MIVITGGAGFIGSATVWALNERGEDRIIVVDELDHDEKEKNLAALRYELLVGIDEFREKLLAGEYDKEGISGIIHLGAISSTTETDWRKLQDRNIEYSKDVIRWCVDRGVRCVYASSAATYGSGDQGYEDEHDLFDDLKPLNLYGKSKLLVDIWARDAGYLDYIAGMRYFNVFGPNEYHKEHMRSMIAKQYPEMKKEKVLKLFKSYNKKYRDGEQKRDFIYVKDAVEATLHLFDNKEVNGVFNIGTGRAESWNTVAQAMFQAANMEANIEYIDMPPELQRQYQYFTQANMRKLRSAGFKGMPRSIEEAIREYVQDYLEPNKNLGE